MPTLVSRFGRGRWLATRSCTAALTLTTLLLACSSSDTSPGDEPSSAASELSDDADYDVQRYDLKGELDWDRSRLMATIGIQLRHRGLERIVLDSAVDVKAVRAHGDPLAFTVDREHQKLLVDLPPDARYRRAVRLDIDYEAEGVATPEPTQEARLFMMPALKGDPAPSRMASTFSEPLGARFWMPCHDMPSDRAVFSIEMRMPAQETLVSNGDRLFDIPDQETNTHRVKYDSGFTLSTYIMAFFVGELEAETARSGRVPISILHRKGNVNDYETILAETARSMKAFERLVGPYPFERYAQIFTPGGGGEENPTITQMGEWFSDFSLNGNLNTGAHELSHHWFGDLVTNTTFYDAWFKEGMATLLAWEAMRPYLDEDGTGTLNAEYRMAKDGDTIVRSRTEPLMPYGTGPYARAAWLLAQIRSILGDDAFFRTLRSVLREYRDASIDTDQFVAAFAPRLGPEATARVRRALTAKRLPRLEIEKGEPAGAFITLRDPDGSIVAPMTVRWIAPDGTRRDQTLDIDARVALAPQVEGEFLVIDPLDVHPEAKKLAALASAASGKNFESYVAPLLVPKGPNAIAQWLRAGGVHQTAVLSRTFPQVSPGDFEAFVDDLDAEGAKMLAIAQACSVAADPKLDPPSRAAWADVLTRALQNPPAAVGLSNAGNRLFACSKVVDMEKLFASDWAALEADPPRAPLPQGRLSYLARFDLPPAREWSVWTNVTRRSPSLFERGVAASVLWNYASRGLVPAQDRAAWRAFFLELLAQSQDDNVLTYAIGGVVAMRTDTAAGDRDALAGLSGVLHDPVDYWYGDIHTQAVCGAYTITGATQASPEWQAFVRGLSDAHLKADIQALVDNPAACP